jgi:hypothetical protein
MFLVMNPLPPKVSLPHPICLTSIDNPVLEFLHILRKGGPVFCLLFRSVLVW